MVRKYLYDGPNVGQVMFLGEINEMIIVQEEGEVDVNGHSFKCKLLQDFCNIRWIFSSWRP